MNLKMPDQAARPHSTPHSVTNDDLEARHSHGGKFRFKSSTRKPHSHGGHRCRHGHHHGHRRYHHHAHRQSNRDKPPEASDNPSPSHDKYMPDTPSENYLDPDTAFRESLFDAMADDEGAQFWEGVYGQPIPSIPSIKTGPAGVLESMTADEYAAYVRAEMYKRTPQYILERKQRMEREREHLAEQVRLAEERDRFNLMVDESLRRGKQRNIQAQLSLEWAKKWKNYEMSWEALAERPKSDPKNIPWPVRHGRKDEISPEAIEQFFVNGPTCGDPSRADLLRTLKSERVRWHPDKVQQKLGGQGVSGTTMQGVTAVFQIIDQMWTAARDKSD